MAPRSNLLRRRLSCTSGVMHALVAQVRDVGADARWQKPENRFTHWDLIHYILTNCGSLNPIFNIPWVKAFIFKIDWLHASDQGCAADFVGNSLWLIKDKMPGRSNKLKVDALWVKTVGAINDSKPYIYT